MEYNRFYLRHGPFLLSKILEHIDGKIINNISEECLNIKVKRVSTLDKSTSEDISFLLRPEYTEAFNNTNARICLVNENIANKLHNTDKILVVSENSSLALSKLLSLFFSEKYQINNTDNSNISKYSKIGTGLKIGRNVVIEDDVEIGNDCYIDHGVIIKAGTKIGNNAIIGPNSTISFAEIGNNFKAASGVRIGNEGFGFVTSSGIHHRFMHCGRVIIGDNVDVGINSIIERGTLDDTIIGDMCKIASLVVVGHNVELGKGCMIISQVGIAGSCKLGEYCVLGGQVGVADHINIASGTKIAAGAGLMNNVDKRGEVLGGIPAVPIKDWHRQTIFLKKSISKVNK